MIFFKKSFTLTRKIGGLLISLWAFTLSIFYIALSVPRHNHFLTAAYDLALFDQAVWQYAHFQWPYNSVYGRFILGDHLMLILPLLAPLYWIWNDVRALLIFQAVWISVSVIAIYKLALVRKWSTTVALCLSVVYGLFYGMQYAIYWDFYPVTIGVGLLAWLAYFFESKKTRWFWITLVLVLFTQENMGIALAGLGMMYLFYPSYRHTAIWFIFGGIAYMFAAMPIIASFSPIGYEYMPQLSLNMLHTITGLFDHVEKRLVWQYSLQSFLFLPLFSPGAIAAISMDLWQYFVLGDRFSWMRPPWTYHRAILGFFLVLGTMDVMAYVKNRFRWNFTILVYVMVLMAVWSTVYYQLPLTKLFSSTYWTNQPWDSDAKQLFRRIPKDATLATQQNFASHLSHRNGLYVIRIKVYETMPNPCESSPCYWFEFGGTPEYVVVSKSTDAFIRLHPLEFDDFQKAIVHMEQAGAIQEVDHEGSIRLYKISHAVEVFK